MPATTFGFSETRNAYTAFYDYYPEWFCSAGNLIISWRNGKLWTHDNEISRANFYNTQYTCSIKLIFNETAILKKHFNSISLLANDYWLSQNQGDVLTNMGNESKLVQDDYRIKDDKYHATFKRDMLSVGGLYNGRTLHGSWLEINLKALSPQNLVNLYYIDLSILEPFNNR
jgi:tricorn protease-like protein